MAESSSAETSTNSNFSGSSHSTNFSAYTSEVESDSEANSSEAGPSSPVVFLLDRLKCLTLMAFFSKNNQNKSKELSEHFLGSAE